jgi:predicted ABC-type ATPase
LAERESFVFETVFSDPVGERIHFLREAAEQGYVVLLYYIGLSDPNQSIERVAMRVSQGEHDVPDEKLRSRFPRILVNLKSAIDSLPHVRIYDNSDLQTPFRLIARIDAGKISELHEPVPNWLQPLLS